MLLGIIIGVLLSLTGAYAIGTVRSLGKNENQLPSSIRSDLWIGFIVLAAFALGSFVTYLMLNIHL